MENGKTKRRVLTEKERRLLHIIRKIKEGELCILVSEGKAVRVEHIIRDKEL